MFQKLKSVKYKKIFLLLASGVVFFLIGYAYASAFTGPTANPPGGSGGFSTDASGNVGIGITIPNNKLQIQVGSAGDVISLSVPSLGRLGYIGIGTSPNRLIFKGGGSTAENFIIDASGRVGIGATGALLEPLHVFGNVRSEGSFIGAFGGSVSAANVTGPAAFGNNYGTFNYAFPNALAVGTTQTAGLQANSLYVNGRIGIGTTDPKVSLHVHSAGTDTRVQLTNSNTGVLGSDGFLLEADASQSAYVWNYENADLYIGTNATARIFVLANGNVGIGATSAGQLLNVEGTARIAGAVTLAGDITFGGAAASNLNMNNRNISGVSKLTVATIDPLYQINGKKYSTYASAIAGGVKEEFVGRGNIQNGVFEIDFREVPEGSDLWVWRQAVEFGKDSVEVLATPYGAPALIYYVIDGDKLIFHGDRDAEFSYRLIGRRFDWRAWPTFAKDQSESPSLVVPQK